MVEREFIVKAIELLKNPLLVFGERHFVLFDGEYSDEEIKYKDCYYNSNPAKPDERLAFIDETKRGNRINFRGGKLNIYRDERLLLSVDKNEQWFLIDWD